MAITIDEFEVLPVGEAVLPDVEEEVYESQIDKLSLYVAKKYNDSKTDREIKEAQWLTSYQNFRGRWDNDYPYTENERNSTFLKVTKTKSLAVYGQILDILFSTDNSIPISIEPTPVPLGTTQYAYIPLQEETQQQEEPAPTGVGFVGDGTRPGEQLEETMADVMKAAYESVYGKAPVQGKATSNQELAINPAEDAANRMTKRIQDQLIESSGGKHLRQTILECIILGSGCMKGPMRDFKEIARWNEQGEYDPLILDNVPKCNHVSVWDFYPDPDARSIEQAEWVIERHRMSKKELMDLKNSKYFRRNMIDLAIERGANYEDEDWEYINDEGSHNVTRDRYEILEYWGSIDREFIEDIEELDIDTLFPDQEILDVNVWVCNGVAIRVVINPFTPSRIPYFLVPYEEDPYNIFGVGLPENMEDSQELINGFARIAVDNAALSSNIMVEIREDNLVPGQTMEISPGKVWRTEGDSQGPALNAIKLANTFPEAMQVVDQFRRWADDTTGIPSALHGQTGVTGIGRTASGISQLLGAASVSLKTFVKNLDDYLLEPLGKAYFAFNMQFNFDKSIGSDLQVKARGSISLASREIQSQKLLQFLQITSGDPELIARRNIDEILQQLAKSLDLDPNKVVLSPQEAALKVQRLQADGIDVMNQAGQTAPAQGGMPQGGVPAEPAAPGEQGFSGTEGGLGGEL